jgi:5-formyltetrahydrofolate cyclo-ligase
MVEPILTDILERQMTDIELKELLRSHIRAALARISPAVRAVESIDLCARLRAQIQSAHTILFFAPLADELDVWPVLEESLAVGKVVALPFFDAEKGTYTARRIENAATDIVMARFGVREPVAGCAEIPFTGFDLVLVPGLAFDLSGNRLGRGRGFYDRMLENASGIKCGVGYDFQLMEKVPTEPHDAKVNFIITPTRCVRRKG